MLIFKIFWNKVDLALYWKHTWTIFLNLVGLNVGFLLLHKTLHIPKNLFFPFGSFLCFIPTKYYYSTSWNIVKLEWIISDDSLVNKYWISDENYSMTQLLSHTMAHFTGPSFMIKANNQPYNLFVRSCVQLSKRCQKLQNFDFQSQFSMSKIIRSFLNFFFI